MQKNSHFSWIGGLKMSLLTPLASFYDYWEIKEYVAREKTDMEFQSFDHTIGFLSFWYIDIMCHTSVLY